jgi:PAS domain S-box-containing protein
MGFCSSTRPVLSPTPVPTIARILGYPDAAFIGSRVSDFVHPEDQPAALSRGSMVADQPGASVSSEVRVRHQDGSWRWLETTTTNLLAHPGISAFVVNFRDITMRRAALAETERLAAIVASFEAPIIGQSLDGRITSWNAGAERLYGYVATDVIGRSMSFLTPPDQADENAGWLTTIASGISVSRLETVQLHRDGTRLGMMLSISPIRDGDGKIIGAAPSRRTLRTGNALSSNSPGKRSTIS